MAKAGVKFVGFFLGFGGFFCWFVGVFLMSCNIYYKELGFLPFCKFIDVVKNQGIRMWFVPRQFTNSPPNHFNFNESEKRHDTF